jgi:hypothetical protein
MPANPSAELARLPQRGRPVKMAPEYPETPEDRRFVLPKLEEIPCNPPPTNGGGRKTAYMQGRGDLYNWLATQVDGAVTPASQGDGKTPA